MDALTLHSCLNYIVKDSAVVFTVAKDYLHRVRFANLPVVTACNTSNLRDGGLHWVCFITYRSKQNVKTIFYDSFGLTPKDYKILFPFPIFSHNKIEHQNHSSSLCGHFVIYKIFSLFYTKSKVRFLGNLSRNKSLNEHKVMRLYKVLQREMLKKKLSRPFVCLDYGCKPKPL